MKKPWYQSKTVWFNVITVGGAVLTGAVGLLPTLQFMMTPQQYALTFMAVGIVNIILRSLTTNAIGFVGKDSSK